MGAYRSWNYDYNYAPHAHVSKPAGKHNARAGRGYSRGNQGSLHGIPGVLSLYYVGDDTYAREQTKDLITRAYR